MSTPNSTRSWVGGVVSGLIIATGLAVLAQQAINVLQVNGTTITLNKGASDAGTVRVALGDGTQTIGTVAAITNTVTSQGAKTNNNAAPGATNFGMLPAVANAAAPSYTEANQVALSTDLAGALRVSGSSGGGVAQNQVRSGANAWTDVGYFTGNLVSPVADSALFQMLQQILTQQQQQMGYLRGTLGRPISSTGTALDVNMRNNFDPCMLAQKVNVAISQTATTQLVKGQAGQRIYLCSVNLIAGVAEIVSFTEGTGTTCATSETAVTGSTTAANGESYAANGGREAGGLGAVGLTNVSGDDLCLKQSGSSRVSGNIVVAFKSIS